MLRNIFITSLIGLGCYLSILHGAFYILLFYIWNAYFRPEEFVWNNYIRSLNLSYILALSLIFSTIMSSSILLLNARIILLVCFLGHSLLSTLFSDYAAFSWSCWLEFFKIIVISYLIITLVTDISKLRLLLLVMALSLGFIGAQQGWYHLIIAPGTKNRNSIPFLGEENGIAVGMIMLVPVLIALAQTSRSKWLKCLFWFFSIGCLYLALSTYSRGAFLSIVTLCLLYWLGSPKKLFVLCQLGVIIGLLLATLPDNFWSRMETISTYEEVDDKSALGRLHFWSVAIDMANKNPYLGIGFNAFNKAYNDYDSSYGRYGQNRAVHSSWFGILAELGYIGTFIFAAIVICSFWNCRIVIYYASKDSMLSELGIYAKAIEIGLATWLVGGSFHIFQYNEMVWHYLILTIVIVNLRNNISAKDYPGK